jgi:hypothetical protein
VKAARWRANAFIDFCLRGDKGASSCSAPIWRANVEGKRTLGEGSVSAGGLLNEGYL